MEGVASSRALYQNTVYPALLPLMRTPRLPAADSTDTPADINGLVRFAGKPNLVSARVPSRSVSALIHRIYHLTSLEELLLSQGVWMQNISITVLCYNNFETVFI